MDSRLITDVTLVTTQLTTSVRNNGEHHVIVVNLWQIMHAPLSCEIKVGANAELQDSAESVSQLVHALRMILVPCVRTPNIVRTNDP